MMASTVDAVVEIEKKATGWVFSWRHALIGGMAAVLVFVALPQEQMRPAAGDNYFGVRGNLEPELRGGIGLSGVSENEQEYEVVQGESRAFLSDWLRIYTTRLDPELDYGFIFGIQKEREPIWYWPNPQAGESASQSVDVGVSVVLGGADPFEFELSKRHHKGELQVVALFTTRPLEVEEVQKALLSKPANKALDTWLKEALRLESEEIIRILEVEISEGSKGLERP